MATWDEITTAAPDLADAVRQRFDAHKHKTLATLRGDGSPRISGIEASFRRSRSISSVATSTRSS
jgi:hypothetical protein